METFQLLMAYLLQWGAFLGVSLYFWGRIDKKDVVDKYSWWLYVVVGIIGTYAMFKQYSMFDDQSIVDVDIIDRIKQFKMTALLAIVTGLGAVKHIFFKNRLTNFINRSIEFGTVIISLLLFIMSYNFQHHL